MNDMSNAYLLSTLNDMRPNVMLTLDGDRKRAGTLKTERKLLQNSIINWDLKQKLSSPIVLDWRFFVATYLQQMDLRADKSVVASAVYAEYGDVNFMWYIVIVVYTKKR